MLVEKEELVMSFGFLGICLIGILIIAALVVVGVLLANKKDNHEDDLR